MKRVCLLVAMIAAMVFASTANAWHAVVAASAKCNVQTGLYDVTASVVSSEPSGAVIKSYSPKTFPGNTTGSQKVYVTVDWADNSEEPTYTVYVQLNGSCIPVCEPTERIVYVDRPAPPAPPAEIRTETVTNTVTNEVKVTPKPKPCKAPKGRKVVRGKDGNCYVTVVKVKVVHTKSKVIHDRCKPPPVPDCVGKCYPPYNTGSG